MAGFLHFCGRTLHRTAFDYSPPAAHPFGAGATGAPFNAFGVSPSRAPLFREPSLWLGFCISAAGLSIELRSIIRRQRLTPSGPARQARRSTPSALVRAGLHYSENPAYGWVFAFLRPDSPSNYEGFRLRQHFHSGTMVNPVTVMPALHQPRCHTGDPQPAATGVIKPLAVFTCQVRL